MNICIDCGTEYEYDSNNPKGSSSTRCCSCRKKDSKLNKKFRLFEIAGNGIIQCRKCGYKDAIEAMTLVDCVERIKQPKTQEEKEEAAKKQFILCLNCDAEIKSGFYSMKVLGLLPVKVEFYMKNVRVVNIKIPSKAMSVIDAIDSCDPVEVTNDNPKILRKIEKTIKKIKNE